MSNPVATYLPSCWSDEEVMLGYMASTKARSVNPLDYDRKVSFWSGCIDKLCKEEKNALFTLALLKRKFRRGDRIPSSLLIVVESLQSLGNVVTLDEWQRKHSSWLSWGASQVIKTSSWFFGSNSSLESARLIHLPTIEHQASSVLSLYFDQLKSELDCTGEVISYDDLYNHSRLVVSSKENFDIVLDYLIDNGDITAGFAKNGDKVIKFKDTTSGGPVQFTEADASVHDIRRAMTKVEKDIETLETKVNKFDADARKAIRAGDKTRAATFLRQKKRAQKDISDKDGQLQGLLSMLHQLASSKLNKEVIDAYKTGAQAFKSNLARHGLSPEKVDETMDDIQNSVDNYKEIEEALSQGFGLRNKGDEDDLEKELDDLLQESKKLVPSTPAVLLPEVPSKTFGITDDIIMEDDNLERRLQRLREAA